MSKTIYEGRDLIVSRHVGPASEGEDRHRWQFTPIGPDNYAILDRREVRALLLVVMRDAWRVRRNRDDDQAEQEAAELEDARYGARVPDAD